MKKKIVLTVVVTVEDPTSTSAQDFKQFIENSMKDCGSPVYVNIAGENGFKNSSDIIILKREIVDGFTKSIKNALSELEGERFEFSEKWKDEANNRVDSISIENGVEFEGDYYPISELGIDDAIFVMDSLGI